MSEEPKQDGQQGTEETKSISIEDHNKAVERARNFEAKYTDLEKRLQKYDGVDLDRLKAIEEDYNNIRKEKASGNKDEIDKLLSEREQAVRQEFGSKLEASEGELKQLRQRVKELEVVDVVMNKAAETFNADCHEDVKARFAKFLDKKDGEIVVKDREGNVRYSKVNPSKLMSPEEFIQELASEKPSWAKPQVSNGTKEAGQRRSNGSSSRSYTMAEILANPALKKSMTHEQKQEFLRNAFRK